MRFAAPPLLCFALLAAALTGCRSDEQERSDLLARAVEGCVRGFEEQRALRPDEVPAGLDSKRLCRCSVEKMTTGMSVSEMRKLNSADPEVVLACGREQGVGGTSN